jgi:hypothetical protein
LPVLFFAFREEYARVRKQGHIRESAINVVEANAASTQAHHHTMLMMKSHTTSNSAIYIEKKMITTSRDGLGQPMFFLQFGNIITAMGDIYTTKD